jgi:hypothetical protein
MKSGKAPGPDGVGAEFYKSLKFTISHHLLELYLEAQEVGFFPDSLTEGTISFLFEKEDPREVRNYRPISLLQVDYKIYANILVQRIKLALLTISSRQNNSGLSRAAK